MCCCCGNFYRDTKLRRCCRWILPITVHSLILYLYVAFTYHVTLQLFSSLPPRPRAELIFFQISGILCVLSLARCLWDTRSTTILREASEQLATTKKEDERAILDQGFDLSEGIKIARPLSKRIAFSMKIYHGGFPSVIWFYSWWFEPDVSYPILILRISPGYGSACWIVWNQIGSYFYDFFRGAVLVRTVRRCCHAPCLCITRDV